MTYDEMKLFLDTIHTHVKDLVETPRIQLKAEVSWRGQVKRVTAEIES